MEGLLMLLRRVATRILPLGNIGVRISLRAFLTPPLFVFRQLLRDVY